MTFKTVASWVKVKEAVSRASILSEAFSIMALANGVGEGCRVGVAVRLEPHDQPHNRTAITKTRPAQAFANFTESAPNHFYPPSACLQFQDQAANRLVAISRGIDPSSTSNTYTLSSPPASSSLRRASCRLRVPLKTIRELSGDHTEVE